MASPEDLLRRWAAQTDPERNPITGPETRSHGTDIAAANGHRPTGRRWLVAAVLAAAVIVIVAIAVRDDPDRTIRTGPSSSTSTTTSTTPFDTEVVDRAGIPVLAGASRPAGTPLRDGLRVPDGAWLLAEPLPLGFELTYRGEDVDDQGWRATLLVTGDLDAVLNDLNTQLHEQLPLPDPLWHVTLTLIRQETDAFIAAPTSHLQISYSKPSAGTPRDEPIGTNVYRPTSELPSVWSRPAQPGEPFGWAGDNVSALTMPADAYEVTHSFAALDTARHISYGTILRIDGDTTPVADDLMRQLTELGTCPTSAVREDDGKAITRVTADDPSCHPGYYRIDILDGGPGHRWAFIKTNPGD